jgi:PAS domain S-box-containing protein
MTMSLSTSKKNTEKQLEQLETFLNEAFAMFTLDANGIIRFVNPLFCEMLKYNADELIGRLYTDVLLEPKLRNESLKRFKKALKSDDTNNSYRVGTRKLKDKNGKTHWIKLFMKLLKDENANNQGLSVIITEVKYKRAKKKTRKEAIFYRIIDITTKNISTKKMLNKCLDVLLTIPWLKTKHKGGFMLKQKGEKKLKMIVHRGLQKHEVKEYTITDYYQEKIFIEDGPYGNYNIPILWKNKLLGALSLYVAEGYFKKKTDKKFLQKVAQIIGAVLYRKEIKVKRTKYLKTQQSQAVLYRIIEISNKSYGEEDMLNDCLKILLNVGWLKFRCKGYVFFVDAKKNSVRLAAKHDVSSELINTALYTPNDACLCQVAIKEQRLTHTSNCTDPRHYIANQENENKAHGHYNVPIIWRGDVLGVIVFYLYYGHQKDEFEEDFLIRVSKVLAAAMFRKRTHRAKDKQTHEIMALSFELKASKESTEEQNSELSALLENITLSHELLEVKTKDLNKKQNNIMASITYAKRIQNALLPKKSDFYDLFTDSFVLDKPRDIVGGDFYWFNEKENLTFIILADCTGHGVPGAFMTVVANSIINDVMEERGSEIPNQILERLDIGINKMLNQEKTKNNDGMDMSLVVIDKINRQIYFSGAKSPMVYLTPQEELREIKGARRSIGGSQRIKSNDIYKMSIINLEEGMWIYLFSDGYRDQFGQNDTKFGKKRFMETLQSLKGLNGEEQHKHLDFTLEQWTGTEKQIDDILCLGFQL